MRCALGYDRRRRSNLSFLQRGRVVSKPPHRWWGSGVWGVRREMWDVRSEMIEC